MLTPEDREQLIERRASLVATIEQIDEVLAEEAMTADRQHREEVGR
jgi:hypothetical protein